MDKILHNIIKRQTPFLIGGTITGTIMTYYLGFLFSIAVNSLAWIAISYLVYKLYWKISQTKDQRYLIQYALFKTNLRKYNQ
jgi:hypothetical protein